MAPKKPSKKPGKKPFRFKAKSKGGKGPKGKGPARKPKAPRRRAPQASTVKVTENPQALALARRIGKIVADMKAQDVMVLDVRGKASYADYVVVASGDNERLVSALADGIDEQLRADGVRPMSAEGSGQGNWVLLDYGDVVAHLFQQDARVFYDLEGLWADAPRERVG